MKLWTPALRGNRVRNLFIIFGWWFGLSSLALAEAPISLMSTPSGDISTNMTALLMVTLLAMGTTIIFTATPFLRIVIVFGILRQASGLTTAPSNKVLSAMALVLTFYIMKPTINEIQEQAIVPFQAGLINELAAVDVGSQILKSFMLDHTRASHLERMLLLSGEEFTTREDVPFDIVWISFVISEIETALKIGFFLYLAFVAVDLITGAVLMSLGMMMLSPMVVSLPIKILLFVMVDGWLRVVESLASSFFLGG